MKTSLDLAPDTVPAEIGIKGEAGPWVVHVLDSLVALNAAPKDDTFHTNLMLVLQEESKSMEDFQAIVAENQATETDVNMGLVTATRKLVDKCNQIYTDGPSYRKQRLFSELKLVPPGEEDYEAWMDQAT